MPEVALAGSLRAGLKSLFLTHKTPNNALCAQITLAKSQIHMRREVPDPFAVFKCLDDFDLYAGDGHFIAAACHDKAVLSKNPAKKSKAGSSDRSAESKGKGGPGLTVLQKSFQRLTQRTVKFVRWLKNHLDSKLSWTHAVARLARIYARS